MGILIPTQTESTGLEAWSVADRARKEEKPRYRSGFFIIYKSTPFFWSSLLQTATALLTTEAEFAALASCVREVVWLRAVINEIGVSETSATVVHQHNLGSITWKNYVQGLQRVKHVALSYQYVKSIIETRTVTVEFTASADN